MGGFLEKKGGILSRFPTTSSEIDQEPRICMPKSITPFVPRGHVFQPVTEDNGNTKAGPFLRNRTPLMTDFGLRTPLQPCQNFLRVHSSLGCFHPTYFPLPITRDQAYFVVFLPSPPPHFSLIPPHFFSQASLLI